MGDSSVSCSLSGLTLHGEPVVFIPLVRNSRHLKIQSARLISIGFQSCAVCSPLALPYRGKLNDYGYFYKGDIQKDLNTELIEAVFKMSIEDFTDKCIQGEAISVKGEQIPGIGCYIHAEIYDRFSKPVTGGKYAGSMWNARFAGEDHLKAIGCELKEDLGEEERYRYVYRHPKIESIQFRTDGEFTNVFADIAPRIQWHGCYGLDDIHKSLIENKYPGFPKEDIARVKQRSNLQSLYLWELKTITQDTVSEILRFSDRSREEIEDTIILRFMRFHLRYLRFLEDVEPKLLIEYLRNMTEGRLLDRAEELHNLLDAFTLSNRLLMPNITGTQYPQHEITSLITGVVDKIAKQRVREK